MNESVKIHVVENWAADSVDLHVYTRSYGKIQYLKEMIFKVEEEAVIPDDSPLRMSREDATELMDRLWNLGFRPRGMKSTAEEQRAKDEHIQDLRKVLDAFLKEKDKTHETCKVHRI